VSFIHSWELCNGKTSNKDKEKITPKAIPLMSELLNSLSPYPINKSATIEVIQNRIVEHELQEGKSNNR